MKKIKLIEVIFIIGGVFCIIYPCIQIIFEKYEISKNISDWNTKREKTIEVVSNEESKNYIEVNGDKLITCYPFRYVGFAPKRYIVNLEKIK